jgi:DNA topoisomerase-2
MAGTADGLPLIHQKFGDRWEVAVSLSDGQFDHLSFVNSIATTRGGSHVAHVADQLAKQVLRLSRQF